VVISHNKNVCIMYYKKMLMYYNVYCQGNFSGFTNDFADDAFFSKQRVPKICQRCSSFSFKQRNKDLGSRVSNCRHVLIYCGEDYHTCPYQRVRFDQFLKQSLFPMPYILDVLSQPVKACIKSNCVDTLRLKSSFRQQISYTF